MSRVRTRLERLERRYGESDEMVLMGPVSDEFCKMMAELTGRSLEEVKVEFGPRWVRRSELAEETPAVREQLARALEGLQNACQNR